VHLTGVLPTQSQVNGGPLPLTRLSGGGVLQVDSPHTVLGGWVDGIGTIQGVLDNGDPTGLRQGAGVIHPGVLNPDFVNNGRTGPGGTVGTGGNLNVTGDFQQTSGGWLWIDAHGPDVGIGIGRLLVGGTAYLGGNAKVVRDPAFVSNLGDGPFAFVNWSNVNGDFAGVQINNNSWLDLNNNARSFAANKQNDGYYLVVQ
jgi:hypothetical protein